MVSGHISDKVNEMHIILLGVIIKVQETSTLCLSVTILNVDKLVAYVDDIFDFELACM